MPTHTRFGVKRQRTEGTTGRDSQGNMTWRRRKGKPRNRMVSVPRNKLAFPQSMRTTVRYVERRDFVPTGEDAIVATYLANGIYDPTVAIGGHRPRGTAQFFDVYKTSTVLASKISVSFMMEGYDGPSTTATGTSNLVKEVGYDGSNQIPALSPLVCGLHKGIETLSSGTVATQMEKDRTQWTYINAQEGHKTLRNNLKVSDFYGKGTLVGAEGYTGSDTSDPTEPLYWEVWCGRASNDYPAEVTKAVAFVTIEFDVVFTEPKALPASS